MSLVHVIFFLGLVAGISIAAPSSPDAGNFRLKILHNNDMHARFEQTDAKGGTCKEQDVLSNNCYGGFARVAHVLREERAAANESGTAFLYLNAGDTYTGTPWFSLYKDNITSTFLNLLQPDAISLGNHEFDEGVDGLEPLVKNVKFPILAANLDFSKVPGLADATALKKSIVFTFNDVKVGVIGYLTPDTKNLATKNDVEFVDEIPAINAEAESLASQGVNIIIALGHSGIEQDQLIGANCPLVDLVIGGHSHTFLYSGTPPDSDRPLGPYPTLAVQPSSKTVPIVQAYAYTKYLGSLDLEFDEGGNLLEYNGSPILLNGTISRDPDILAELEVYRPGVIALQEKVVGETKVLLDGSTCRREECNLGNLITDGMVYEYARTYSDPNNYWTDAAIAFMQGGGIRTSIDASLVNGQIKKFDLAEVMPFGNNVLIVEVTGADIKAALERSVERYTATSSYGEFLQMSGINVEYNLSNPSGARVESVKVLCALCDTPTYSILLAQATYKVIISDFMYDGGDGYEMFKDKPYKIYDFNDIDTLENYLGRVSPVYPAVQWRITLNGEPPIVQDTTTTTTTTPTTSTTSTSTTTTPSTSSTTTTTTTQSSTSTSSPSTPSTTTMSASSTTEDTDGGARDLKPSILLATVVALFSYLFEWMNCAH